MRGQQTSPSGGDRIWALAAHIGPFFGLWILIPVVIWSLRRGDSEFVRWHAAQSILISLWSIVYYFVFGILFLFTIVSFSTAQKLGIGAQSVASDLGGMWMLFLLAALFLPFVLTSLCSIAAMTGRCWRFPIVGPSGE